MRVHACGEHMWPCVQTLLCDLCVCLSLCFENLSVSLYMHVCVCLCVLLLVCVCLNGKLTAAVKFLSEHHRGEADGSWQGARVKGGGRGRWRWEWSRGRRRLPASLMIEGLVKLCRNPVRLLKNTNASLLLSWPSRVSPIHLGCISLGWNNCFL